MIVSSFSGNTEETLSCYDDGKRKGAKLLCITSGGELLRRATQDGYPVINIPGGVPPRTALGYLAIPILVILSKAGFSNIESVDFDETENLLTAKVAQYSKVADTNR